ncbi:MULTISPECIES: nucleoside-diphosphate kinase [unclassified Lentimonas]|uniref:nucleoside-diphosphate kinase n=1 Tax=unclassified Lentimonas TaxID=2630993 RepID=UPI00132A47A8|nr:MULTISPECIES: nucleoside-diphosphate kinase [unclassified Lentimonas]CAA6677923.1 Nucleoside diphosphate kinase (EC [Lentimonas sp. CC4]CAA6684027.1 Nucleoside diphosphate kinase (EC [Lentimonas sp. CC6]CAA6689861.1 Nucleoside diphosphate kinase (EC [Lentimonas sp. CC10]CAA6697170.1 Nucleoside diphosphate kinase (EC [Lentimonas sp. CC19]CAA7069441.1 Nucleoside diphosphate kinase (EC [Lentimonas sp. CC11]
MEETLIILKPDCMEKRIAGEVITRFENAGFEIVASKVMQLDGPILREHYAHVADLPFFPEIEAFMSSRTVMPMILSGENVIAKVRELLGPTNSKEAPKGTIRGDLGTDMMRNVVHASDSPEAAAAEKARFFPEL